MIKKLRRKFILISILSVFFVLFVTIMSINISNYAVIENNARNTLDQIVNVGTRPNQGPDGIRPNFIDLRQEQYFLISFDTDGNIKDVDTRQMFIYSDDECKELATKVYSDELVSGALGSLRYLKTTKPDQITYIAFIDINKHLDSFQSFLLVSSLISIGAYLALIGLIMIASKFAFKSNEEVYKKQKIFITNASHELKTPITIISADLDLLEMDNGKNEWSESIRDQLTKLTNMTNQLIMLSKFEEEDKSRFPFNDFSLDTLCKDIIDSFLPSFEKENIKFSYRIADHISLHGNKSLIDELIHIFLDNSLKYTGGENKSSNFIVDTNNKGKIEFRFSNTIDKQDEVDTKQIMERFYRSPSNKKEGSGVGLSIAQEIINIHKAKIAISKNDDIISFVITF